MTPDQPVAILGCGRLGSAIVEGWLKTGAVLPERLVIFTPSPKPVAEQAQALGARVNPGVEALSKVGALVLAVKPAIWRAASEPLVDPLAPDAVVVSVMAGVRIAPMAEFFANRPITRVMPTTGVAQAQGVASIWSNDPTAHAAAHALFQPIAELVDLADESLMDAATAVAGSGPAYFHAFTQALAEAGVAEGLSADDALRLARATLRSAAAGLADGSALEALIARIASPGGTTQAGLNALAEAGMPATVRAAVEAATRRSREMSA
jgi:pyrroline-5-carboxylate reductase